MVTANNYLTNGGDPASLRTVSGPRWYSFDVPGLHVVAMDWHTHELGIDDQIQEAWLREDLAHIPEETPWILLFHDQPGGYVLDTPPARRWPPSPATGTPRGWWTSTATCMSTPRQPSSLAWTTARRRGAG